MGSSSSKLNAASSSSSTQFKRSGVFQSSCLGQSSTSHDHENDHQASDHQTKENDGKNQWENQNESTSDQMKAESFGKSKAEPPNDGICISTQSSIPRTRFLSCFSFFPSNISFRLSRATSLGPSSAYPVSSTNFAIPNEEEQLHLPTRPQNEDFASSNSRSSRTFGFHDGFRDDHITSTQDLAIGVDNDRVNGNANTSSPRNFTEIEGIERRFTDRWNGYREPVERNVRFSRTLSVGRLRDRVIRRSSFHDLTICPLQHERLVRDANQDGGESGAFLESHGNPLFSQTSSSYAPSAVHSSLYGSQDYALETSRAREARYRGLLENRSNFLERRRRIRSQVRALQRLGGRFENLSGHERSCILSAQHRTGRCTCRNGTQDANSNDDSNARASISRIVILAEALFEVLDEIQQQSVVLSSQPSISPIGSGPAPNERVECLPLKIYSKSQKHLTEEIAQCYICLVEYEEGDSMRILPCHHEFHRICVDKWLKEIHRVCPLCRGDICRSASLPADN